VHSLQAMQVWPRDSGWTDAVKQAHGRTLCWGLDHRRHVLATGYDANCHPAFCPGLVGATGCLEPALLQQVWGGGCGRACVGARHVTQPVAARPHNTALAAQPCPLHPLLLDRSERRAQLPLPHSYTGAPCCNRPTVASSHQSKILEQVLLRHCCRSCLLHLSCCGETDACCRRCCRCRCHASWYL
jgi:hypothetical protein